MTGVYNNRGSMTRQIRAPGTETRYSYDAVGRMTQIDMRLPGTAKAGDPTARRALKIVKDAKRLSDKY
jgi:YD repeat-containing protein